MIKFASALPLAAALAMSIPAPAAHAKDGWYGGLSVGMGRGKFKEDFIADAAEFAGVNPGAVTQDKDSWVFKAFVGYSMTEYLGFEGGLFSLGSRSFRVQDTNTGGSLLGESKTYGANLDLVGTLPLGNWRLIGRVGGYYGRSMLSFESDDGAPYPPTTSFRKTRFNWKAGAGVGYEFASNVGLRVEWERYRVDVGTGEDRMYVDTITGSVLYRF
jgi:opacity protein-like surface antigen